MALSTVVKTEGFAELDRALRQLPRATMKNTMRRAAREALEPMKDRAVALAPDAPPYGEGLKYSIKIDTKLNPRAKAYYKFEGPSEVFMHMGPALAKVYVKAVVNEFGSYKMGAQPYMRPAWDAEKMATLDRLKKSLWEQVSKAAARAAKKAARAGGR